MPNYTHYLTITDAKAENHEIAVVREKNGKLVVSLTAKGLESCTKSAEKLVNTPIFRNSQVWGAADIKRYTGRDVSAGEVIPKACLGRRLRSGEVIIRLFGWLGSFGKYRLPDPISGGEYVVCNVEPEKIPTDCPIITTEIRKKGLNGDVSIQKLEILAGTDKWFPVFPPKEPIEVHEKGGIELGTELGDIVRGQFAKFKKEQGTEETRAPETSQSQKTPLVSTLNTGTDETTSTPVKEEDEAGKKGERDDSAPCSLYDGKRFGVFVAIPKDGNTDHHFGKRPLPLHALEKIKQKYPTAEAWAGIQWDKENLGHGVNGYENTYKEVKEYIASQPEYIKKMLYVGRRFGEADDLCICIDFDGGGRTLDDIIEMCGGVGIIERSMSGTGFHAFGGISQQLKQQIDEREVSVFKNNGKEIDGINLKGDVEFRTGCSVKQNGTALTEDTVFTGTEFVFPASSPCLHVLTTLVTSSAPQTGHTTAKLQPTQAIENIINHFINGTPLAVEIDPLIKDEFIPKVREWAVLGHMVDSTGLVYEPDTINEDGKIEGESKCSNTVTSVFARINPELGEFAAIHDRHDLITLENALYTLLSTEIGQYFYVEERKGCHTYRVSQFLSMLNSSGFLERTAEAWDKVQGMLAFFTHQEEEAAETQPTEPIEDPNETIDIKAGEELPKPEQPAVGSSTPQPSLPSAKHPAGFFIEKDENGELVPRFYCDTYQTSPLEYILAELANMVLERAFISQWIYGYMGGMIIGSVLTARNYKLDGQFSNIYALLFGQSSVGKTSFEEAIQKVCNIIVKRCDLSRHLIGDDEHAFFSEGYAEVLLCGRANAASAAGAHVLHARNPHFIGFRDENQDDVGRLKKNEHEKGVSQYNTDLWSIKGEDKYPPVRADDGKPICKRGDYDLRRITIRRPAYSCIDAGIGESYAKELPAYIRDGTYARYLFITAPNIQDLKFNHEDNNPTPYELPNNRWSQLKGLLRNATFSPFLAGEIVTLKFAIGVLDIIDEKLKNIHNRTNKPNKIENTEATAMMAKACENATRLAIPWTLLGTKEGVAYLKELSKLPAVYSNVEQIEDKPKTPVILPTPPIVTPETWLKCYSITNKNYTIVQELFESFVVFDGKIIEFATKMYEIMNSKLPAPDSYITEREVIQQMKTPPTHRCIEEIRECIKQNYNIIAFKSGCSHQIYYARDPEQAAAAIKVMTDALKLAQIKKYK